MSDLPPGIRMSVGTDIEDVARFDTDAGRAGVLFDPLELAHAAAGGGAASLTGTWCAKEAAVKALWPWIRLDPRRVVVHRDDDGRPTVEVTGWDAAAAGLQVDVSIAHTSTVATAVVVAWGSGPAAGPPTEREPRP